MSTLTDRYVWAVVRLLPEAQRAEIADELRSTIADTIDGRTAHDGIVAPPELDPAEREVAEREVLVELGDPAALASQYADRPRYVVSPQQFPQYVRVLRLVAAIALPIVGVVAVIGAAVDDDAAPEAVLSVLGALVTAAVQIGFWVTLVFACIGARGDATTWSVESLPELPAARRVTLGDTIGSLLTGAITIGVLVVQQFRSPVSTSDGTPVPVLEPNLWDGWMWVLLAVLVAGMATALAVYRAGRWTLTLAAVNIGLDVAWLAILGGLALVDRLWNPEFFETLAVRVGWDTVPEVPPWIVVVAVGAVVVWDAYECLRDALRPGAPAGSAPGGPVRPEPAGAR